MGEQGTVDYTNTDYTEATRSELEWWLLFSAAVANWKSDNAAAALGRFKFYIDSPKFPLMHINDVMEDDPEVFEWAFSHARFRFNRTKRTFAEIAREFWCRDLRELTVEELESIYGIGPKTARFFLFTAVPGVRYAALDVHILRWLSSLGYPSIPKGTPSGKNYQRIEEYFLQEADARGIEPAKLDLEVWTAYKNGGTYEDTGVS
jgi:thermostable 8-oxoguanine DNA glycosylase